jgi:hypothetical protein
MTPDATGADDATRLPNLLIAGVGKAGTTSLFHYLSQHPDICASSVKEPRYFRLDDPQGALPPIESYLRCFARCDGQAYRMEASPQYFKGGERTIALIRETLRDPRVILLFRDPVTRLWSEYRFRKSRLSIPSQMTFDAFVARCEAVRGSGEPRSAENEAFYQLAGGSYAEHVEPWLEAFGDRLAIWFFEHLAGDPPAFVERACAWLGIDASVARTFAYSIENRTVSVRSPRLQRLALAVNREGGPLRNRRGAKAPLRRVYYALNRRAEPERMTAATRERLEEGFAPSNAELARILGAHRRASGLPDWLVRDAAR